MHMLYIDVPGIDAHTAHRLVVATLTHYGFQLVGAQTKQSRGVARVSVGAKHCADAHETAALLMATALPAGTRVGIGAWSIH